MSYDTGNEFRNKPVPICVHIYSLGSDADSGSFNFFTLSKCGHAARSRMHEPRIAETSLLHCSQPAIPTAQAAQKVDTQSMHMACQQDTCRYADYRGDV